MQPGVRQARRSATEPQTVVPTGRQRTAQQQALRHAASAAAGMRSSRSGSRRSSRRIFPRMRLFLNQSPPAHHCNFASCPDNDFPQSTEHRAPVRNGRLCLGGACALALDAHGWLSLIVPSAASMLMLGLAPCWNMNAIDARVGDRVHATRST